MGLAKVKFLEVKFKPNKNAEIFLPSYDLPIVNYFITSGNSAVKMFIIFYSSFGF